MSKRRKPKKAPAARADEPAPVPHFDATRMAKDTWRYTGVAVTWPNGSEANVMVPTKGRVSKKKVSQAALQYVAAQERVRDAWRDHLTEEQLAPLREGLLSSAAGIAAHQLVTITLERFREEGLSVVLKGAANESEATAAIQAAVGAARGRMERVLRDTFEGHPEGLNDQIRGIEYNAVTGVLLDFEQEHGDTIPSMSEEEHARLFTETLDRDYDERRGELAVLASQNLARHLLEALEAGTAPLAKLREYIDATPPSEGDLALPPPAAGSLRVVTGQIMQHMYSHVSSPELATLTELTIRRGNSRLAVRARSSTNLQAALTTTTSELLEKMHRSILSVKRHGAALLKVQLDLMGQAYAAGGATPLFYYDLSDALERQGYTRDDSRRAYDSETMQGLRERIVTLAHQQVDVLNLTETDKKGRTTKYIDSSPYWVIEATRRREEGDEVNAAIVLLADPNAPIVTGFTMRPGLWWQAVGVGDFYLDIPAAVLELPTHANSNEPERLALQLTPLLAIWERASQRQHAGKSTRYAAGTLLTEAGYTTREAFMTMHPTQAQRTRDYLASTNGAGAIAILNRLGAFSLEIEDEAAYFASGRGWRESFWEAQIRLNIRNLGIAKKRA